MSQITRANAAALVPEDVSDGIFKAIPQQSYALRLMRRLRDGSRDQLRLKVQDALAQAYFTEGGRKGLTSLKWKNKYINYEEVAAIVAIDEDTLEDADIDIWAEVRPALDEAFGRLIDGAIFFGTARPNAWPAGILPSCYSAGNIRVLTDDRYADISAGMAMVENHGYEVTGTAASVSVKSALRNLRDDEGRPLFQPSMLVGTPDTLFGQPIVYVKNGSWISDGADAGDEPGESGGAWGIGGDFQESVYSFRKGMTYKVLTEASLYGADDTLIHALAQEDKIALRVNLRIGWEVPNPINPLANQAETVGGSLTRYPFSAIVPAVKTT